MRQSLLLADLDGSDDEDSSDSHEAPQYSPITNTTESAPDSDMSDNNDDQQPLLEDDKPDSCVSKFALYVLYIYSLHYSYPKNRRWNRGQAHMNFSLKMQ